MKISEIKKAYDTVHADEKLKEKIFSRLEADDTEEADIPIILETSHIKIEKRGGLKKAAAAICAAAAMVAAVLVGKAAFDSDPDISVDDPRAVVGTSAPEITEIPPNTALVKIKVVDWDDGTFLKNMRVDYVPIIFNENSDSPTNRYYSDKEHMDRAGTIPMTYERSTEALIPYGDYVFIVSNALPNEEFVIDDYVMPGIGHMEDFRFSNTTGMMTTPITVDENTTEIVLEECKANSVYNDNYKYAKLGVTLLDADGSPLPDYTVILQPADGIMAEGYSDEYGGYVLTRTNEKGEAFWRSQAPVEGDYRVIAYREELHPISEPILEPFVFEGDNTISYTHEQTVFITYKTFKEAKK